MFGFAVGEHPDVGGDAGIVEEVQRQGDDGFEPVVLDDPAADIALALAGIAGEEGRAVVDLGDAAAEGRVVVHLRRHVGEEKHLAVAGAGDEGEFLAVVHDLEARVAHAVLAAHGFKVFLPALAVGRVRHHEVELHRGEGVVGEGGPFRATDDVVGIFVLALEEHVGFADGRGGRQSAWTFSSGFRQEVCLLSRAGYGCGRREDDSHRQEVVRLAHSPRVAKSEFGWQG